MDVEIRPVRGAAELSEVARLRYQVYVEEMGRAEPRADHANRRLEDRLDSCSTVLGAFDDGRVVGTVRLTSAFEIPSRWREFYLLDDSPPEVLARVTVVTKLATDRRLRRRTLGLATGLCTSGYRHAWTEGVRVGVIDCNPPRFPFFERMGFLFYGPPVDHEIYGTVSRMLLPMGDRARLAEIGSPFAGLEVPPDESVDGVDAPDAGWRKVVSTLLSQAAGRVESDAEGLGRRGALSGRSRLTELWRQRLADTKAAV